LPREPVQKIGGNIGPDMDVANGIDHGGLQTYTIWGENAYQIGGKAGYEMRVLLAEE
jgi:hypothetical protein